MGERSRLAACWNTVARLFNEAEHLIERARVASVQHLSRAFAYSGRVLFARDPLGVRAEAAHA